MRSYGFTFQEAIVFIIVVRACLKKQKQNKNVKHSAQTNVSLQKSLPQVIVLSYE